MGGSPGVFLLLLTWYTSFAKPKCGIQAASGGAGPDILFFPFFIRVSARNNIDGQNPAHA